MTRIDDNGQYYFDLFADEPVEETAVQEDFHFSHEDKFNAVESPYKRGARRHSGLFEEVINTRTE